MIINKSKIEHYLLNIYTCGKSELDFAVQLFSQVYRKIERTN